MVSTGALSRPGMPATLHLCLECLGNRAQLPHSSGKEIENTRIEAVVHVQMWMLLLEPS